MVLIIDLPRFQGVKRHENPPAGFEIPHAANFWAFQWYVLSFPGMITLISAFLILAAVVMWQFSPVIALLLFTAGAGVYTKASQADEGVFIGLLVTAGILVVLAALGLEGYRYLAG